MRFEALNSGVINGEIWGCLSCMSFNLLITRGSMTGCDATGARLVGLRALEYTVFLLACYGVITEKGIDFSLTRDCNANSYP